MTRPSSGAYHPLSPIGWGLGQINPLSSGYNKVTAGVRGCHRDGDGWLDELVTYLQVNRNVAAAFVRDKLPGVEMTPLEGTYLAWLDCRRAAIEGNPHEHFLNTGRIATNDGAMFGAGGEGFVRLNLACPRDQMLDGLERIRKALSSG